MSSASSSRVVIVGGAIMGSFCAWSLRKFGFTGPITVVEKDATYQYSSTALSAASIRTQFGTPANIRMSLYGARMFRNIRAVFGNQADIGFQEKGYLILGRTDQIAERCGYRSVESFRVAFRSVVGVPPSVYRQRFGREVNKRQ